MFIQIPVKTFFAICTLVLINENLRCVNSAVIKRAVDKYTTKYDNIDVNRIVASRRLMLNYVNCLLEKGPCTPEGKELKTYLSDALQTECAKCSKKQKEITGIVLAHMVENYKDLWDAVLTKYDPDGDFRKKYEGGYEEDEEEEEEEDD